MKSVLITGGSGFIGSHFHNAISQQHITNLDLVAPSFEYNSNFVKGDIRKPKDLNRSLFNRHIDTIISLAAMHHDFGISKEEYFDTNERGTEALCNAATKYGITTIVFFSSVAVYGNNQEPSTEQTLEKPNMPYGASKLAGEKVLRKWASENDAHKVLIIRPALVFGVNNTANMYNLINQINRGIYFHLGNADNIKSIAYVENVVEATLWLLKRLKPGVSIYNYADEPHLTSREIAEIISEALGRKIRMTLPKSIGIMLGVPFDLLIKVTGKNLAISSSRIRKLAKETYHSAEKIFTEGFKAKYTTKSGLREMVKWYLSQR